MRPLSFVDAARRGRDHASILSLSILKSHVDFKSIFLAPRRFDNRTILKVRVIIASSQQTNILLGQPFAAPKQSLHYSPSFPTTERLFTEGRNVNQDNVIRIDR
jgi:hypothetical protein